MSRPGLVGPFAYAFLVTYALLSISYMLVTSGLLFEPQGAFVQIKLAAALCAGVGNCLVTAIRYRRAHRPPEEPSE